MNSPIKIKLQLLNFIKEVLHKKMNDAKESIAAAKESRNNDTKSSAGDKYETGRAMMQQEIDKNEMQLNVAMKQLMDLSKLNVEKTYSIVDSGSLVTANGNKYFISIGMGKIEMNGEFFYAISLASPIGLVLKNKTSGDKFIFQGKEFEIGDIF